jgi:hypothetical protein
MVCFVIASSSLSELKNEFSTCCFFHEKRKVEQVQSNLMMTFHQLQGSIYSRKERTTKTRSIPLKHDGWQIVPHVPNWGVDFSSFSEMHASWYVATVYWERGCMVAAMASFLWIKMISAYCLPPFLMWKSKLLTETGPEWSICLCFWTSVCICILDHNSRIILLQKKVSDHSSSHVQIHSQS